MRRKFRSSLTKKIAHLAKEEMIAARIKEVDRLISEEDSSCPNLALVLTQLDEVSKVIGSTLRSPRRPYRPVLELCDRVESWLVNVYGNQPLVTLAVIKTITQIKREEGAARFRLGSFKGAGKSILGMINIMNAYLLLYLAMNSNRSPELIILAEVVAWMTMVVNLCAMMRGIP